MIVGSTVALRSIVTVPLAIYHNKLLAEIEMRQPTISMMTEALKHRVVGECRRSNQPPEEAERQYLRKVGILSFSGYLWIFVDISLLV